MRALRTHRQPPVASAHDVTPATVEGRRPSVSSQGRPRGRDLSPFPASIFHIPDVASVLRYSAVLLLLAALVGCMDEAPRDNPFDPLSERYEDEGVVSGVVTGIYGPPYIGREGVNVRLLPDSSGVVRSTTTDATGRFEIDGVPKGGYLLVAEGDGLQLSQTDVAVRAGHTTSLDLPLNALPVILSQDARTVHIERWFPETSLFRLEVEAIVTDPDRPMDVDSVKLVVDDIDFEIALSEVVPGHFEGKFDAEVLPGGQVQAFLGRPIRLEVTDVSGHVGAGEPMTLVRVIEQTPLTASPQGLETAAENPPVLEWRPAQIPFPFTYRVDLNLIDGAGIPRLIESETGIDPTATNYAVERTLDPGDYYWTVWVVDSEGNRSRSKEAGFTVE